MQKLTLPHDHNRRAWDSMVGKKARFARPADDEDLQGALRKLDPGGWLEGRTQGARILCLAAGGGRQSAIYAEAGADVTVVDLSGEMLALDRQVAAERNLKIRCVQASMDDLGALHGELFDIVIHPVSTCYVPQIAPVYREVAKVTRPGGIYISQHKQPASLQADVLPAHRGYELVEPYYREGPLPAVEGSLHREAGTIEYLHRWEELIGEMCRAGFAIEDLTEPLHADPDAARGTFKHRSIYLAPYVRCKARRQGGSTDSSPSPRRLWTPDS